MPETPGSENDSGAFRNFLEDRTFVLADSLAWELRGLHANEGQIACESAVVFEVYPGLGVELRSCTDGQGTGCNSLTLNSTKTGLTSRLQNLVCRSCDSSRLRYGSSPSGEVLRAPGKFARKRQIAKA